MKKIVIFLVINGLLVLAFIKTDGFSYIGDKLTARFTSCLWLGAMLVFLITFLYLVSGFVKKYTDKSKIISFKE